MIDLNIAVLPPSERLDTLPKCSDADLNFRVVLGEWMQKYDPPHAIGLLRAHRKRPRCRSGEQREERAPFRLIEVHFRPASAGLHDIELAGTSQRVEMTKMDILEWGWGGA